LFLSYKYVGVWEINIKNKYLYYLVKKGAQDLLLVLWGKGYLNVVEAVHQWF